MRFLRMVALGAAAVVAYKLWRQRQPTPEPVTTYEVDYGDIAPPHGDLLLGTRHTHFGTEAVISAAQSSRGFGGT
ncbi:hypothetical protein [Pseudoxanthomonas sp.]|uniref:hypothetical protein n=1 Tax=Pseudoxanthomonas sp. TaxID=1871049 RepID=UPI00262FB289|nr:hypothetical protein [Pseudoxanthomonas sp.]WDS34716.1 MAG: hypothetical protein O8I58_09935 [Pseudoxanthomonas sp.]